MYNYNSVQQGWQCPICKRVYSPFTPCCFSCGGEGIITSTDLYKDTKTSVDPNSSYNISYLHQDSTTKSDTQT